MIECILLESACMIDGDVSDADTKVYRDGSAIFKILLPIGT